MTVSQALEAYLAAHHDHARALAIFTSAQNAIVDAMLQQRGYMDSGDMFQQNVGGYNVKLIRTDGRWRPIVGSWTFPSEPHKDTA